MRCSKRAVQVVSITEDEASIQLCTPAPNAERLHRHASCRYIVPAIRAVTGAGLTAAQAGQHCQLNLFADNRQTHLCAAATGLLRHWRRYRCNSQLRSNVWGAAQDVHKPKLEAACLPLLSKDSSCHSSSPTSETLSQNLHCQPAGEDLPQVSAQKLS